MTFKHNLLTRNAILCFGLLYCIAVFGVSTLRAQNIITTVAGNGVPDFSGDGDPATSASLQIPRGLARDSAGNLFIADTGNHRIRRVDAVTGIITTVAG